MRRLIPCLLVLAACSGNKQPVGTPGPERAPERAPTQASRRAPAPPVPADTAELPPLPQPDPHLIRELTDEARLVADSAADEALLEKLADAHPAITDDGDVSDEVTTVPATWDIDVTTWGDHERVQYYLDFFQGPGRERMQIWLDRLPRYESMIRTRMQQEGLPSDMVYLALIESGFSNSATSRSRAVGMWQFMKGTGKLYGLRIDSWVDERRDPVKATDAAARHLQDLRERFGSLYLAAAAYNAGGGKISRGLKRIRGWDEDEFDAEDGFADAAFFRLYDTRLIRRETKDYVPKLIAAALIAKEPEKYGFRRGAPLPPYQADSVVVIGMTGLDVIARLADTTLAAVRELNPHLLRLITPPTGKAIVRVPSGRGDSVSVRYAALPPSERVTFLMHTVRSGDTFSGIARRYRVPLQLVVDANPKWRGRKLRTGTTLYVPTSGGMSPAVAREVASMPELDPDAPRIHRVQRGETLSGIARRYRVSQASLRRWNGLGSKGMIRAGQRLRVSAPVAIKHQTLAARAPVEHSKGDAGAAARPRTHLVRRGDTLTRIARRYGVTVNELREANRLTGVLKAGTRLKIPNA